MRKHLTRETFGGLERVDLSLRQKTRTWLRNATRGKLEAELAALDPSDGFSIA